MVRTGHIVARAQADTGLVGLEEPAEIDRNGPGSSMRPVSNGDYMSRMSRPFGYRIPRSIMSFEGITTIDSSM